MGKNLVLLKLMQKDEVKKTNVELDVEKESKITSGW